MYVFFFFLIYLFIRVFSFQEKHPKYHPYSIISEGQQIDGSINPHEIFVYQINSVEQSLEFLFRADDKKALFYLYRTEDIEELHITEPQLIRMLIFSQLNEPQIINGYLIYSPIIKYTHSLNNDNQVIILLYCSFDVPCSFFLSCVVNRNKDPLIFKMNLTDNQSFLYRTNYNLEWKFQLPGKEDSSPVTFNLNAILYSGLIDLNEFFINDTKIEVNRKFIANQETISFTAPYNTLISFNQINAQPNLILYQYTWSKQKDDSIKIKVDFTNSYSVKMKSIN